jgi:signal transduction histidine kinase
VKRTIRVRLTMLYTGLFLITSALLLSLMNLSLGHTLEKRVSGIMRPVDPKPRLPVIVPRPDAPPPGVPLPDLPPEAAVFEGEMRTLPSAVLEYQWGATAVTVALLTLVSVLVGWWLAGRILRPLRDITATARHLSLSNLHERIAATGPRDELRQLADTFDAMLERLERSVESQRLFIANAAHELRTPLATQRAAIQIGLADPEDLPAVRETLLIHNRRTERLIDSLLVLAQAEHGLDATQPVALDVLARQAVIESPPDDITVSVEVDPVTVLGDPVLLNRLLVNLVQNAFRYNVPNGSVYIGLKVDGTLTVRNTGPDVPVEHVASLFQPFRQLQSRTKGGGAGLGLSIVASIARAHHANLAARANVDGGLEVSVCFPLI